jgi:hypothetical protein
MATWKKGLVVLALTAVVLATPVVGIEVRRGNLTSPATPAPHNHPRLFPLLLLSCLIRIARYFLFSSESGYRGSLSCVLSSARCWMALGLTLWFKHAIDREWGPGQSYSHIFLILYVARLSKTMPTV